MPTFGSGAPRTYRVQPRGSAVTQQAMSEAAVRSNGGRNFNIAQNVGYYGFGSVTDLIDTIGSSIPGLSSGLNIERQDFNNFVTRSLDLPGMSEFYLQNQGGIEVGSGIAAIIGAELVTRKVSAPGGAFMQALRKTPYLRRIAALDNQYAAALQTVKAVDAKLASRGLTGAAQLEARATVDTMMFDAASGQMVNRLATLSRSRASLNARVRGAAIGVRDAAITEAQLGIIANQNGFLYDDSAAYNVMLGALGLGAGGALNWFQAGYAIRKGSLDADIVRTFSDALDPDGLETTRLTWMDKVTGSTEESIDWFGGAYTDKVGALGLEAAALKETPLSGTDDTFTLGSQREALATQVKDQQRIEIQKVTTKGLPSDGRTRFSMKAPGYGNHIDMMLHRDPLAMQLVEAVGGVNPDVTGNASQVMARHTERVTADIKRTESAIEELMTKAAENGQLSAKESRKLHELQSRARRLAHMDTFTHHVSIDGEWMPLSEAATIEGFTSPTVKVSRVDKDKRFWEVADSDVKKRNLAVGSDLEVILPGGAKMENADYYDALRMYRLARDATQSLAKSNQPIALPNKPHWFQLDMAEEILRLSDGTAQIMFPKGMTRESAQVESFIQKAQHFKKLEEHERRVMSRGEKLGKSYDSQMAKHRVRFNLPKLTAYERGVLGTNEHSAEFLMRGMTQFSPDDLRKMSLREIKDAVAQTKRLKDAAQVSAHDIESLTGNSFRFMLDESDKELKPIVALMRPFKPAQWTQDALAERLAARKLHTVQTLTDGQSAPLSRELSTALFESEDFHLASRPDQLMEGHIQGSVTGATPSDAFGALTRELKPSEWSFRDSPLLLAAGRLRDKAGGITRARMREVIETAFGDNLKLLSNPRNASTKLLLNQFHSFRSGWDMAMETVQRVDGDKVYHAFKLTDSEANRARYKLQYGEEMPKDAVLRSPDGTEVVLDELGLKIQAGFNQVTDSLIDEKNTLLRSMGRETIRKQNWFTPSPQVEGQHVGFVMGPDNKIIPGFTVNESTTAAFAKSRADTIARMQTELPNGGMGYTFRTQDQIRQFADIWDEAAMDMINPGTTAIQPGKRGSGKLTGANVKLNAFEAGLTYLQDQYLKHGNHIVETLMKEQINAAKSRAAIAQEVSRNRGGTNQARNFRSVHDYYLEALQGRNKSSHEGSIIGNTARNVEAKVDSLLQWAGGPASRTWQATTDWLGKHRIWDRSAEARKDFDSLTEQLGEYMPFKNATELAERRQAGVTPLSIAKITGGINKMTAAITLRILETAHPVMNLSGILNAMPAVIRQFEPRAGESTKAFADRVGHSALIFNVGGESIATLDIAKIGGRALKKSWNRAAHADYDFMMKRGYITQEVAEFQRQFGVIDTPGRAQAGLQELVKKSSVLSDKSEDFSRAWGHFIGLEMADILGIAGRETRHSFAHDIANKMIANYSPANRPEIFQGAIGSMFGLFQSFAWNYYSRLFRYMETSDLRAFATQYGVQTSLFGVTGLTGWDQASTLINWASDGERDIDTGVHGNFTGGSGDLLAHGVISQIPKIFGFEGVNLYSRGDTSVRVPGVGTSGVPGISAMTKISQGIGEGLKALWDEHPTLTRTRMAEIASNMIVNRPLAGTIEQFFAGGNDTDRYGQLVSDTRSWAEFTYRTLGVRSERQSKEVQAFYSDKRAQEQQASAMERLRLGTRAAIREGRSDMIPQMFEQYLQNGGDPRYFRRWYKGNYEAATTPRSNRVLDDLLNNPANFSRAMRFMDMGVSIEDSDAAQNAPQQYAAPDSTFGDPAYTQGLQGGRGITTQPQE